MGTQECSYLHNFMNRPRLSTKGGGDTSLNGKKKRGSKGGPPNLITSPDQKRTRGKTRNPIEATTNKHTQI